MYPAYATTRESSALSVVPTHCDAGWIDRMLSDPFVRVDQLLTVAVMAILLVIVVRALQAVGAPLLDVEEEAP